MTNKSYSFGRSETLQNFNYLIQRIHENTGKDLGLTMGDVFVLFPHFYSGIQVIDSSASSIDYQLLLYHII